jgi:hypothetical protein
MPPGDPCGGFLKHSRQGPHGHLAAVSIQNLNEAAHVRAAEVVRQTDWQSEFGDRLLLPALGVKHRDGIAKPRHSNLVDLNLAVVTRVLDVLHRAPSSPR